MDWPKDTTEAKNAYYGDFRQPHWQELNLIRIEAPFMMRYGKVPLVHGILVHRKIANSLNIIFNGMWEFCRHDQAAIDRTGLSDFGGCYNVRKIAGSNNWSNHSWACAIDLSPSTNGFRHDSSTTLASPVIDAFKGQEARWGGDYKGRKDPMHFEFVSPA